MNTRNTVSKRLASAGPGETELIYAVGSDAAPILQCPHLFFENTELALETVAKVLDTKVGLFMQLVPFGVDYDADPYEHFHMWSLPENQGAAMEMRNSHLEFNMAVSVDVPTWALKQVDEHPIHDYYSYMEFMPNWISNLKWAYIPLEYENWFAIFVAAPERHELIIRVESGLKSIGVQCFSAKQVGSRFIWDGPLYLRTGREGSG